MKQSKSTAKEKYRQLCASEPSIPIFSRDYWLDAVAGAENWDVVLVERDSRILASLPYVVKRFFGFTILGMPLLTQTLGPWLRPSEAKYCKRLGQEKDILQSLIGQLPHYHYYSQRWHHLRSNWLPFYWEGFQQTTRYTYRLPEISDEEKLWASLQENIRGDIRKAKSRFALQVRSDLQVEDFLGLNIRTFARQGKKLPYSSEFVFKLDRALIKNNARKIFIAEDADGRYHAGVYIVWDQESAYYLMGGGDSDLRQSGAASLCMWEAIKFARTVTKSFDFEGSMIEPIERFFRAFGAIQTPYFSVSRITPLPLRIIVQSAREVLLAFR